MKSPLLLHNHHRLTGLISWNNKHKIHKQQEDDQIDFGLVISSFTTNEDLSTTPPSPPQNNNQSTAATGNRKRLVATESAWGNSMQTMSDRIQAMKRMMINEGNNRERSKFTRRKGTKVGKWATREENYVGRDCERDDCGDVILNNNHCCCVAGFAIHSKEVL